MSVARGIVLPRGETAVALARNPRHCRIDAVEIGEHGSHRGAEAVNVEAAEFDALARRAPFVLALEPFDELQHFLIAPHPGGKAGEGRLAGGLRRTVAHVSVDAGRVRPIGLGGNDAEAMVQNQMAGDRGAGAIKFACSVRRFAQKNHSGIAIAVERSAEFLRPFGRRQGLGGGAQSLHHLGVGARAQALGRSR